MKQYTREERDRKIADINKLCADGSLTLTSIQNVVRMFVKQEVLASERMVDRPICAREVLLRDLSHCILHYTQDQVYKLKTFVKHANSVQLARRMKRGAGKAWFCFETDFSNYDSSQSREIQDIEAYAIEIATQCWEARALWKSITETDLDIRNRAWRVLALYSRCSGEKTTSLFNTLVTHTFNQFCLALHLANDNAYSQDFQKLCARISTGEDLSREMNGDSSYSCVEGDDTLVRVNTDIQSSIEDMADMLGFEVTVVKRERRWRDILQVCCLCNV